MSKKIINAKERAKMLIERHTPYNTKDGICDFDKVRKSALSEVDQIYDSLCDGEWWDQDQIITIKRVYWMDVANEIKKIVTPKEKAIDLIIKMDNKKLALILVDEILSNFGDSTEYQEYYEGSSTIRYYQEVKQQIQLL